MRIAILISGRGSNMTKLIDSCKENIPSSTIELVFSNSSKAIGLEYAKNESIPTEVIDHKKFETRENFDDALHRKLKEYEIDFICNAGFMRILSKEFVKKWFNKQINIHPSILPAFKGLDIHKRVIDSNVQVSGCTVHLVRAGVDEGPIVGQLSTYIDSTYDEKKLANKVLELEHILYPTCLKLFSEELIKVEGDIIKYSSEALIELQKIQNNT